MGRDLQPDKVLERLEAGRLDPFYLFYGPAEFLMERVLDRIRAGYIPEGVRDFNQEILYGEKNLDPSEIIGRAQSAPFMASNRLIVVRRTEALPAAQLSKLVPYLENPTETTCVIFVSQKTNFRVSFYKAIRDAGLAVSFEELKGRQVTAWIRRTAKEMELELTSGACDVLQEVVGNRLRDLHGELEKLRARYGSGGRVDADEVRELAIHSRSFTIFELVNLISVRDARGSLSVLSRFLEEEGGRDAPLGIIGMLNRQVRLLWQTKAHAARQGRGDSLAKRLGVPPFAARRLQDQSVKWREEELERALYLLYDADERLKSGSLAKPVIEALVVSLCAAASPVRAGGRGSGSGSGREPVDLA